MTAGLVSKPILLIKALQELLHRLISKLVMQTTRKVQNGIGNRTLYSKTFGCYMYAPSFMVKYSLNFCIKCNHNLAQV